MNLLSISKVTLLVGGLLLSFVLPAQELYVFSEPASNIPARSISVKASAKLAKPSGTNNMMQRYMPEVMFGLSKKWMVRGSAGFSDMYSPQLRWESARLYTKYRFLSIDEVHRHFRMAAFAEGTHSRNDMRFQELSMEGDQSAVQTGIILTQLWQKLAVSSTLGYLHVTKDKTKEDPRTHPYQALNYSLSAGYLVLPVEYRDFKQTNLNVYAELLGQQSLDMNKYLIDFAPAVQLIFNSNTKLNLGYRFQLGSNMQRMARNSWMISFERVFLGALGK